MIIKERCCFLKDNIEMDVLKKYNFKTYNEGQSYWLHVGENKNFVCYSETRRFVRVLNYWKVTGSRKVKHYLKSVFREDYKKLVEIRPFYMYLVIFKKPSKAKREIIEKKLKELNNEQINKKSRK